MRNQPLDSIEHEKAEKSVIEKKEIVVKKDDLDGLDGNDVPEEEKKKEEEVNDPGNNFNKKYILNFI